MNKLRDLVDKIKPHFSKGGKLEKLESTFDAFETFLFVPNTVAKTGSHIRDSIDLKRVMILVVVAAIPAMFFGMWNIGFQHYSALGKEATFWTQMGYGAFKFIPLLVVSYVVGLGIEFAFAQSRGHEVNEGYLVSGFLIPLIVPPDLPLWMLAVSVAFAVIFGKEVFGGTGMNVFNPALLSRAFLFFAYPSYMSGDKVWIAADGVTQATPLGTALTYTGDNLSADIPSFYDMFIGIMPGSVGETSALMILIGAVILLFTRMASWRIMLSILIGGYVMGWIFNMVGSNPYMDLPPHYHFVMGGFAFGMVFMATDPVSAAQTNRGKWIYGFLIGFFAVLLRVVNPAYPEGMMLAILLMNAFSSLIDYYVIEANVKKRLKRLKLRKA
ncbi:MAG TPA: NADH:ubiquinone reductase (Na(+)-transporting) subunit B [Hydrogenothermaceae bacterium]|nr:NADH:ubiquinone reductase (Na(+)-transporting) subunit B [Hydrogenothermaceae bacterium]